MHKTRSCTERRGKNPGNTRLNRCCITLCSVSQTRSVCVIARSARLHVLEEGCTSKEVKWIHRRPSIRRPQLPALSRVERGLLPSPPARVPIHGAPLTARITHLADWSGWSSVAVCGATSPCEWSAFTFSFADGLDLADRHLIDVHADDKRNADAAAKRLMGRDAARLRGDTPRYFTKDGPCRAPQCDDPAYGRNWCRNCLGSHQALKRLCDLTWDVYEATSIARAPRRQVRDEIGRVRRVR